MAIVNNVRLTKPVVITMLDFDKNDKTLHFYDNKTGQDQGSYCEGFLVTKVFSDINTGDETVNIEAYTNAGKKVFNVEAKNLTVNNLPQYLLAKGVCVLTCKEISEDITAYTLDSKKSASVENTFSCLGWYKQGKTDCYLASNLITAENVDKNYTSTHSNKLMPVGSFQGWRNGLEPFLSRPEVGLALSIGASATIIPLLKEAGIINDTLIFALIGKSSTFKTTALKLMASIYGMPKIGDGIIDTLMDTAGYFFENLGKKNGFVQLVDDISAVHDHDFTNELYHISMGKSRGRLSPDGKPRKVETWCTTVVYTGETSIFAQTNKNKGLYARLIEFNFSWLTENEDIDAFYDTINGNYGTAIEPLVQTLFNYSSSDIRNLYKEAFEVVTKRIPVKEKDGISRRIVQRFAILIMALNVCNKAWGMNLQVEPILALLEEAYLNNIAVVDPITIAIEGLKAEILDHNQLFIRNPSVNALGQRAWGVHGKYNNRNCLWISEEKMEGMAKSAGVQNLKDIQKELADRGFLVRDKSNHYRFDRNFENGFDKKCYGVYLNSSMQPNVYTFCKKKRKAKKDLPRKKTIPSVLADDSDNEE